ncbi:MAG TPA: hypothetical protein VFV67_30320 [Actinophytocola sp.]|uniref:hypothetical protein n=1 Tax=Actinophytocola sp. TaxID=1872138 RepID=UPI002DBFA6EB|nr:hypothetical protein [Actinophytocola sp.]HEU5474960.1 hypothetical protein [Actinophytocola sp.]
MNLAELADAVARIGVPSELVVLGGHAEYCWCVEQAEDGAWEVFWQERGNKNNLVRLPTEDTACHQLLGRLTYSQLLAGAIHGP